MKNFILSLSFVLSFFTFSQQLDWVGQFTSTSNIESEEIATDSDGNIYVTGKFFTLDSADFDPGSGSYYLSSSGNSAFVCKLDPYGDLIWAKRFGGSSGISSRGITVDNNKNVYLTGSFSSIVDFDPGLEIYNLSANGGSDLFVSKLNSDGEFEWAFSSGGTWSDIGQDIAVDDQNNIYVAGQFQYADFDPGPGEFILSSSTTSSFIAKYDENGTFINAANFESTGFNGSHELALDNIGSIYLTGSFSETCDFDPGPGIANLEPLGADAYVAKLDTALNYIWVKRIGGLLSDNGRSIAVNQNSEPVIAGTFRDTFDIDPGSGEFIISSNGSFDLFILKLNSAGEFLWAGNIGGADSESDVRVAMDIDDNIYILGNYSSTIDLDIESGIFQLTSEGGLDIFISQLDGTGSFLWGGTMGGTESDIGTGIIVTEDHKIYHTGKFYDTIQIDPIEGANELYSQGQYDSYIQSTTGLNQNTSLNSSSSKSIIKVFPNPTEGEIIIDFENIKEDVQIKLTDLDGKILFDETKGNASNILLSIGESSGIYFLNIQSNSETFVHKIIKK